MKLLDKKTVNNSVATEKKNQIDNGIILAKKIDALRETLGSLEAQHAKFIAGMQDELKEKTYDLQKEVDFKNQELKRIEEERLILLEPLDQAWDEVQEREINLDIEQEEIYEKRSSLTIYNQQLDEKSKILAIDEQRIEETKKQIDIQVDKITQTSLEAQNTLLNARNEEIRIISQLKKKEDLITNLEGNLRVKERELEIRESLLATEEQNIINEKKQLADQRATLERALARIKTK